jgi:Protein of unknown function (DUF2892)
MATTETLQGRSSKLLGNLDNLRERSLESLKGLRSGNNINVGNLERVVSVLGGAALAAWALKRRSKGTMGLALAGLPLVWRGATGHCAVYDRMGIDRVHGNGESQGLHDKSTGSAVGLESTGGETHVTSSPSSSAPGGLLGQEQSF